MATSSPRTGRTTQTAKSSITKSLNSTAKANKGRKVMANPLKLLKLKATGFQFIQEIPIDAPPAKVWKALLDVSGWFYFSEADWAPTKLEPRIGGLFTSQNKDGSIRRFNGIVAHIE